MGKLASKRKKKAVAISWDLRHFDRPATSEELLPSHNAAVIGVAPTDELPYPVVVVVALKDGQVDSDFVFAGPSIVFEGQPARSIVTADPGSRIAQFHASHKWTLLLARDVGATQRVDYGRTIGLAEHMDFIAGEALRMVAIACQRDPGDPAGPVRFCRVSLRLVGRPVDKSGARTDDPAQVLVLGEPPREPEEKP